MTEVVTVCEGCNEVCETREGWLYWPKEGYCDLCIGGAPADLKAAMWEERSDGFRTLLAHITAKRDEAENRSRLLERDLAIYTNVLKAMDEKLWERVWVIVTAIAKFEMESQEAKYD